MGLLRWLRPKKTALEERSTADYETWYMMWQNSAAMRRPPWSYFYADLMLFDHQVWFGTCISNAPLMSARVEVSGPSSAINQFVEDQYERLWSTSKSHIVRAKYFGYCGLEVTFTETERGWEIKDAVSRHPRDTRPLFAPETVPGHFRKGELIGVRFFGTASSSYGPGSVGISLPVLKSMWLTYDAEYGQHYGHAALERAFGPFWDKAMPGGAYDLRRLRNVKDAWIGDVLKYPLSKKFKLDDGTEISARNLARMIGEARVSGGVVCLPNDLDKNTGQPYFEYQPPQVIAGQEHASDWIHDLDWDIYDGLIIPREVVEAAASGSGFSGRSFPFITYLGARDDEFACYVRDIDAQVIRRQVAMNHGEAAAKQYTVKPIPLLETFGDMLGQGPVGGPIGAPANPMQFSTASDSASRPADQVITAAKKVGNAITGDIRRRLDFLLGKKKRLT